MGWARHMQNGPPPEWVALHSWCVWEQPAGRQAALPSALQMGHVTVCQPAACAWVRPGRCMVVVWCWG